MFVSSGGVLYDRMRAASEGKKSKRKRSRKIVELFPRSEERKVDERFALARSLHASDPPEEIIATRPWRFPGTHLCTHTCIPMTCMTPGVVRSPGGMDVVPTLTKSLGM